MTDALSQPALACGAWFAPNYVHLCRFVSQIQQSSEVTTAVFDWDNTCIFGDIGEATFRQQLEHLYFKLTPQNLVDAMRDAVSDTPSLAEGIPTAALIGQIDAAFTRLQPHLGCPGAAPRNDAHATLCASLAVLYDLVEHHPALGPARAYRFLIALYAGLHNDDVAWLVREAWQAGGMQSASVAAYRTARDAPLALHHPFDPRLRTFAEMANLCAALHRADAQVYVVSASFEATVRACCAFLGFPIAPARIYGMRDTGDPTYPLTYRSGKVDVIRRHLPAPPALVAGDANTDYEMLTQFPQTSLRLVMHRYTEGDICRLHSLALRPEQPNAPITLLQGRDMQTATLIARQLSWPDAP